MDCPVMDDQPSSQPVKPAIPTPDLPQPSTPSSMERNEPVKPANPPSASPVQVKTIDAREAAASETQAGSLAPFNTRLIAMLLDGLVAGGLYWTLAFVLPHFAGKIAWLAGMAYIVMRDSLPFLDGQSLGKRVMKLKAVTLDGKSLVGNLEAALIRNVSMIIPPFPLIELIVLLIREGKPEHGRRLGDEWAKTKVIIAEDPPAAA